MITFKTEKDGSEFDFTRHIVEVDGEQFVFAMFWDALEFIYSVHSRRARASV